MVRYESLDDIPIKPLNRRLIAMSDAEVEEKFRSLAAGRLDRRQVARLLAALWKLDEARDIAHVIDLLDFD